MKINHELTIRTIANGATRGFCTCGWRSKVSDEGHMFMDDYVSEQDIKREFTKHVTGSDPEIDTLNDLMEEIAKGRVISYITSTYQDPPFVQIVFMDDNANRINLSSDEYEVILQSKKTRDKYVLIP